jgi:DNA-binding XRE family transcriptional regulator
LNISGKEFKKELRRNGIAQENAAVLLGISRQTLFNRFKDEVLSEDFVQKVKRILNLDLKIESVNNTVQNVQNNVQYDQTNKGSLSFRQPETNYIPKSNAVTLGELITHDNESPYIDLHNGNFLMVVPKIPIKASAGYRENFQDEGYLHTQFEKHYFTVPGNHYRGRYFAFVVDGDSMENYTNEEMAKDSIPNGCVVTGRELQKEHWKSKFHLKSFQDYIIVHRDVILVKRILEHDTVAGTILCNSLNPDKKRHPDFEILLNECLQILNIVDVSKPR